MSSKGEKRDQPDTNDNKDAAAHPPDAKKQIVENEKEQMPSAAVEQGRIAFFYRAKLNVEDEPESLVDVQRFYMILSPTSRQDAPHRCGPQKILTAGRTVTHHTELILPKIPQHNSLGVRWPIS